MEIQNKLHYHHTHPLPPPCGYWCWNEEISDESCQKLISSGEGKWTEATVKNQRTDYRKSDIVWNKDQWVFDLIWPYMLSANEEAGWKYNIVAAESVQITRYNKGGFYSWHRDGYGSHNEVYDETSNEFRHGNTRKLSMCIILNSDFEGGDFQIRGFYEEIDIPKLTKGSVIVFPPFMEHRVTPVTKGTRYSLVAWFVGPPYA